TVSDSGGVRHPAGVRHRTGILQLSDTGRAPAPLLQRYPPRCTAAVATVSDSGGVRHPSGVRHRTGILQVSDTGRAPRRCCPDIRPAARRPSPRCLTPEVSDTLRESDTGRARVPLLARYPPRCTAVVATVSDSEGVRHPTGVRHR